MTQVSTLLTAELIGVARRRGLAIDAALERVPVPLALLEDKRGQVEWVHFAEVMEILEELDGGPDGLAGLSRALRRSDALGQVGRLFRFAVSPRQLYQLAVRYSGPRAFPCQKAGFELLSGERYRVEIRLDAAERGCEAFYRGVLGFYEMAPNLLGLGEALVESEIDSHRGVFLITPPPSGTLLSRFRRFFHLYRGAEAAIEDLREHHLALARQGSELRSARAELAESERRFADAFHASPVPMIISPFEGDHLIDANESFLEATGLSREDLATTPVAELPLWPPGTDVAALRGSLRLDRPVRGLGIRFRDGGGRLRSGLLSSSTSRWEGRKAVLIQVVDVTDHEDLQARLRQSQKMEVVGQLAGGVAHDFNNLLTVISGYADEQVSILPPTSSAHEAAQEILRAAERASKLTGQLLAFGRRQILRPRRVELSAAVHAMLAMLRRLIPETVTIRDELTPELGTVIVDPHQLEQVVLNLVLNARDAMSSGGELTLFTRRAEPDELQAAEGADLVQEDYLVVGVRDRGAGMSEEVKQKIFEPFFTTKPAGEGTGLGLSTVQGIVVQSGGRLRVTSRIGAGTEVSVFLPEVQGVADPVEAPAPPVPGAATGQTVLLVEDEERVRDLLRRQLEGAGYRVLTAGCGADALALEADHDGPIHALVSDVVMPRMGGTLLAERMRERRPGMRVLFMSGYPIDQTFDDDTPVIPKPFRLPQLEAALRSLLNGAEELPENRVSP